jgi:hypothetical protein
LADSPTLSPSTSATILDEVVMALVAAFSAVLLRQLDAIAFDPVDRADMDAIGPDDFHVFLDFFHGRSPGMVCVGGDEDGCVYRKLIRVDDVMKPPKLAK